MSDVGLLEIWILLCSFVLQVALTRGGWGYFILHLALGSSSYLQPPKSCTSRASRGDYVAWWREVILS